MNIVLKTQQDMDQMVYRKNLDFKNVRISVDNDIVIGRRHVPHLVTSATKDFSIAHVEFAENSKELLFKRLLDSSITTIGMFKFMPFFDLMCLGRWSQ